MNTAAILIVVWLGLGSAVSYQVQFTSGTLCDAARKEVLDDAARVRADMPPGSQATTSAVCLAVSGIKR